MATKAIFFDLGGTLLVMRRAKILRIILTEDGREVSPESVHSAYAKLDSWWLSKYGNRALSPEATTESYVDMRSKAFSELFPLEGPSEVQRLSELAQRRWPDLEKSVPLELYPDTEPLLRKLTRDGYSLALISNAPPDTAQVVEALGLTRYPSPVVISGVVGFSKPHPEIFRIALRQANVSPNQTVHVGDLYEADVIGARSAGITGVLIDREGIGTRYDCPRIKGLDEVYKFIR